jgi:glucokinase
LACFQSASKYRNMKQKLAIGIDIGGTNTSYGIVDETGKILAKGTMFTTGHESIRKYIAYLQSQLGPLMDTAGRDNVAGVGIGAPNGNYYTGEIAFAPNLPWKGIIPLSALVTEALGVKTTLTNDAKAAAIGEMTYGAARGMKNIIMVTLGTGLGSGFVANGQLIYGHDGLAGELGHTIAERNGRLCNCGRYGCLERYASATGVVITAEEWLETRNDHTILRQHKGKITAKLIYEAGDKGDAFALEIFEYTAKILGQSLADAVAITSPEAIVLFGGLARSGDLLLSPLKKHFEENLLPIYQNKIAIIHSALPEADAAILGASSLVWNG